MPGMAPERAWGTAPAGEGELHDPADGRDDGRLGGAVAQDQRLPAVEGILRDGHGGWGGERGR